MNLIISLRAELLKTKRTASYYLTLAGAAAGPLVFLLNVLLDDDELDGKTKEPLNALFRILSEMNGVALFPLFIILICTLLPQMEYRNNTWKQVFTSPQTKANVFLAKLITVHLLMAIFLVATHLFMFLAVVAIHFIKPGLGLFTQSFNERMVLANAANAYVMILAVCAIQFWIGLRSRNFIAPVGVGVVLWLLGTIMAMQNNSPLIRYFPYSFPGCLVSPKLQPHLSQIAWTSVGYAIVFLIMGFLDFRRKTVAK